MKRALITKVGTASMNDLGQWSVAGWGLEGGDYPAFNFADGSVELGGWPCSELREIADMT